MIAELLYKLYAVKSQRLRKFILIKVTRLEAGEIYSKTLRRIFNDYHDIEIGMYSYGGCFNFRLIDSQTKIGRYCSFAEGVCIFNRNHPVQFRSTHPFFFNSSLGYVDRELVPKKQLTIGNDVWIGRNTIILSGVDHIGDGAVIGAGAVVTKDVPDFAIVAGNPAAIIKYRFGKETIRKITAHPWWNKEIDELSKDFNGFLKPIEDSGNN